MTKTRYVLIFDHEDIIQIDMCKNNIESCCYIYEKSRIVESMFFLASLCLSLSSLSFINIIKFRI